MRERVLYSSLRLLIETFLVPINVLWLMVEMGVQEQVGFFLRFTTFFPALIETGIGQQIYDRISHYQI